VVSHADSAERVTVLVVDDHPGFRRTASELIAATVGFEQVGEAESGAAALAVAPDLHPDLVLLDVRMPGMDGVETSRRLARACPDSKVVFVSVEPVADLPQDVRRAPHVRKQDLSPRALRSVWATSPV
jgi:DNA-binding NarL/FixJ family response regulator